MQTYLPEGVLIQCDACHATWDQVLPMIEGHRGSVLCLECLKQARSQPLATGEPFMCVLCQKESLPATLGRYRSASTGVAVCADCLEQAANTFSRDPDVDWSIQS